MIPAPQIKGIVFPLLVLCTPTFAWEFTPGPPCILTHETPKAEIELTYDPTQPLYTITVTRDETWPDVPRFGMRFDGPRGRQIGTDQHVLGGEGHSLTVANNAFGNLLDGLQYNETARAFAGGAEVVFSLAGAAEPVKRFRECEIPLS